MSDWINELVGEVKQGKLLTRQNAEKLYALQPDHFHVLIHAASELRQHFRSNSVKTCSIVNAKSGYCNEDCAFCAQSIHHACSIETYALMSSQQMLDRARKEEGHSKRFGIVTAGKGLDSSEVDNVRAAVEGLRDNGLDQLPCASLGTLGEDDFRSLKRAGLSRYHHNLETSKRFYNNICSTHSYQERVDTIRAAKRAGLEICVGGIWGMGETDADRIDLLYEIAELEPNSVPINFLVPIAGTPLADRGQIPLWEAVKIIALARFIMPNKDIKLGAGRLQVFRDAQHLVFLAGANGMIVGDLLTVKGRALADDLAVVRDLGLVISS